MKPRRDGVYVRSSSKRRRLLRFTDDGGVLLSVASYDEPLAKAVGQLEPKVPGKAMGVVPARVRIEGDHICWTLQRGWEQYTFEGTWTEDRLDLDVTSSHDELAERGVFEFLSRAAALAEKTAPKVDVAVQEPPSGPPEDAKREESTGWCWQRVVVGTGTPLTSAHIVMLREWTWRSSQKRFVDQNPDERLLQTTVFADEIERVGDVVRLWLPEGDSFAVSDYEVLFRIEKYPGLRRDGAFVGALVDGRHLVVRFLEPGLLLGIAVGVASVEPKKIKQVLEWLNLGSVKGLFLQPAIPEVDGDTICWVSQVSMDEQIVFTGRWSNQQLLLQAEHLSSRGSSNIEEARYEHLSDEDVTAFAAKKPDVKISAASTKKRA